jgi:hypothetical protein
VAQLQEKQTELVHKVKQLEIEQERLCKQRVSNKTELEIELASYYDQVRFVRSMFFFCFWPFPIYWF